LNKERDQVARLVRENKFLRREIERLRLGSKPLGENGKHNGKRKEMKRKKKEKKRSQTFH